MSININLDAIISFLISPEIQQKLLWVQFTFLSIGLILLIAIIILIFKTHYYQWLFVQDFWEFLTTRPFGAKRITKIWNKIINRLSTGAESESKMAVIEADDLLDASLKRMGFIGQTLEEKLGKLTSATVGNLDDVYAAHKVRNNIVHNPDYRLSQDEAKATLGAYQRAFNSLQILT
ncbi:MAG: hypothetical protein ABIG29_02980 [Candidatus Nealsonbacteria bacterium]